MYQRKKTGFFLFLFLIIVSLSCSEHSVGIVYPPENSEKITITQGVWGNVWFWEGDFMPLSADGKITPVVREIYIYQATPLSSVERDSVNALFIREIKTSYVDKIESDSDGFFQISLPPGKYSFFVKEDSLFYATEADSEGILMSAAVDSNEVVKRQIDIKYAAAF